MKLEISMVPYGALLHILPQIDDKLQKAAELTSGRCCADDLVRLIYGGQYSLWIVFDAEPKAIVGIFLLEIKQYPQKKMLCIQHCVIDDWVMGGLEPLMHEISVSYAKQYNCNGIEFTGRPGWKKYAKESGYTSHSVTYQLFFGE